MSSVNYYATEFTTEDDSSEAGTDDIFLWLVSYSDFSSVGWSDEHTLILLMGDTHSS
jgi:hypothetical protein